MPMYQYQVVEADGSPGEEFEVLQKMSEPALTHHPETGKPVVRVFCAPNALKQTSASNLSSANLDRLGFTQYKKAGGGHYEKTAGKGPNVISRDDAN